MKILKWIEHNLEELLMVLFLALIAVIMGIQVCARYLFGYSFAWSEEIARYLFIWSGFLSVSYCTKRCISIKIEQLVSCFSKRKKAFIKVINHTIELLFFLYLIPFAFFYLTSSIDTKQLSPACQIPMYMVQAAPLISFLLVTVRIIQRWIAELLIVLQKD